MGCQPLLNDLLNARRPGECQSIHIWAANGTVYLAASMIGTDDAVHPVFHSLAAIVWVENTLEMENAKNKTFLGDLCVRPLRKWRAFMFLYRNVRIISPIMRGCQFAVLSVCTQRLSGKMDFW
jgi:hypothetical protein